MASMIVETITAVIAGAIGGFFAASEFFSGSTQGSYYASLVGTVPVGIGATGSTLAAFNTSSDISILSGFEWGSSVTTNNAVVYRGDVTRNFLFDYNVVVGAGYTVGAFAQTQAGVGINGVLHPASLSVFYLSGTTSGGTFTTNVGSNFIGALKPNDVVTLPILNAGQTSVIINPLINGVAGNTNLTISTV